MTAQEMDDVNIFARGAVGDIFSSLGPLSLKYDIPARSLPSPVPFWANGLPSQPPAGELACANHGSEVAETRATPFRSLLESSEPHAGRRRGVRQKLETELSRTMNVEGREGARDGVVWWMLVPLSQARG